MAKVDWDFWRHKFVTGNQSLKEMSEGHGAPAFKTLRNKSSAEDWPSQRKRYKDIEGTQTAINPDVQATVARVEKIIDAAEMLTRHMQAARLVGQKAIQAMRSTDPATLKPETALSWLKWAVDAERMTEGLATERQEVIDLSILPDAALEKLANGG